MSFAEGAALSGKATNEIVRVDSRGPSALTIKNKGLVDVVPYYRRKDGTHVLEANDVKYSSEAVDSDTDTLSNTPIAPGSLSIVASTLTLIDRDGDGTLRYQRGAGTSLASGSNGVTSAAATRTLTASGETFQTKKVLPGDLVVLKNSLDKETYSVVAVNSETVLLLNKNFAAGAQTAVGYEVFSADLSAGTINYFTGALNLSLPATGAIPGTKGSVVGTNSFPLDLEPGNVLAVNIDAGGAANATFDAAAAKHTAAAGTFAAMSSETMEVQFGASGEVQTITFGTEASIQLAVDLINAQLEGGYAVAQGAQNVDIYSDDKGTGARVRTSNVAAGITTKLGIADAGDDSGTGDVADINAVTFAEFKTVVEADVTDSLVTLDDVTGGPRITSDSVEVGASSIVQCTAGVVATAAGLDATAHDGADTDASSGMTASYTKTSKVDAGKRGVHNIVVGDNNEVSIRFAANASRSLVRVTM